MTTLLVFMWPMSAATPNWPSASLFRSLIVKVDPTGSAFDVVEGKLGDSRV